MPEFESLTSALGPFFDKPLSKLPVKLRRKVEKDFLVPWKVLSPLRRRIVAVQLDWQSHPALHQLHDTWWAKHVEIEKCERTATNVPIENRTAEDVDLQEKKLCRLRNELAVIEVDMARMADDLGLRSPTNLDTSNPLPLVTVVDDGAGPPPEDRAPVPGCANSLTFREHAECVPVALLGPEATPPLVSGVANETSSPSKATARDEAKLRQWLTDLMREQPNDPRSKEVVRKEAKVAKLKFGARMFLRAWGNAIADHEAEQWSAPGPRKSKRRIDTPK